MTYSFPIATTCTSLAPCNIHPAYLIWREPKLSLRNCPVCSRDEKSGTVFDVQASSSHLRLPLCQISFLSSPLTKLARGRNRIITQSTHSVTHPAYLICREPKLSLRNCPVCSRDEKSATVPGDKTPWRWPHRTCDRSVRAAGTADDSRRPQRWRTSTTSLASWTSRRGTSFPDNITADLCIITQSATKLKSSALQRRFC